MFPKGYLCVCLCEENIGNPTQFCDAEISRVQQALFEGADASCPEVDVAPRAERVIHVLILFDY